MWLTRVLNRLNRTPISKDHTNEFTGIVKESLDPMWRRRKVKMMTGHYYGRERNCFSLGTFNLNFCAFKVSKVAPFQTKTSKDSDFFLQPSGKCTGV